VFFNGQTSSDYLTFAITVSDPCATATFTNNGPTLQSMTVVNGQTATQVFNTARDSVDGTSTVKDLCGPRAYGIYAQTSDADNAAVSWMSIAIDTP